MSLRPAYPYYLGNAPVQANTGLEVRDKFSGELVSRVALADAEALEEAIRRCAAAQEPMRALPAHRRAAVLEHCVGRFEANRTELAEALCIEAGKPIADAKGEVGRLIDTFRVAAQEATRIEGRVIPMDISPRAEGYRGMYQRVPVGPCAFISPFNFPLNLVAHKIAPALAVGCPFVLKPASLTPIGALQIGAILAETDLPRGAFSILPCARDTAKPLCEDERFRLLSFTGSPEVGWELKRRAGKKKVVLELGGNAACIIDADWDLDDAVARVITGAFYQSGQSCIGVQRILCHTSIYEAFKTRLLAATQSLVAGDPRNPQTFLGPMISTGEAQRLQGWIQAAVAAGARLLCGGERCGAMLEASLLEDVPRDQELYREEAFGPVALLSPFEDFAAALTEVNDSRFGLQAGIFTRDLYKAQLAWDTLEVGAVVIGDVPSWRVDHMPYGGVKDSGLGREGLRYAMEDMSELRLMVTRDPPA